MNFDSETKVKDIALSNPAARQILEDAGVDYCCGGGKSLQEACLHTNVPAEEILNRLRENSKHVDASETNWISAPLSDLTGHIRAKHHGYTREAIPRVGQLLERVQARHGRNHPEIGGIQELFTKVGQEMIAHMQKEEMVLFPYIEALEKSAQGNRQLETPFFQTVRNPVQTMMTEHDHAGELVKLIRKASADYTPPMDACTSYKALYQNLREFEADLHKHVHLENNILFPRAVALETIVL